jgi:hypothetical protein
MLIPRAGLEEICDLSASADSAFPINKMAAGTA